MYIYTVLYDVPREICEKSFYLCSYFLALLGVNSSKVFLGSGLFSHILYFPFLFLKNEAGWKTY